MLVIDGNQIPVPGLDSASYLDNAKYGWSDPKDYSYRKTRWVRNVCLHTRMGKWPQIISATPKNRNWDKVVGRRMSVDKRRASWHISIDADGSFVCHADLLKIKAFHAGQTNEYSVGIEMYQSVDGTITQATLDACVKILDVITRELGIQRQFPEERVHTVRFASGVSGASRSRRLAYIRGGRSSVDFCGIFGHRNATRNRGQGDPGDKIWDMLEAGGYERFSTADSEDMHIWERRQNCAGIDEDDIDGVPGPATRRALTANGRAHGLWVIRPGD